MSDDPFCLTTSAVAAALEPPGDAGTVRGYADGGLVECLRLPSGQRLFKRSAPALVQKLRAERLAHRGGRRPKRKIA
jgi:hypothetical protein